MRGRWWEWGVGEYSTVKVFFMSERCFPNKQKLKNLTADSLDLREMLKKDKETWHLEVKG